MTSLAAQFNDPLFYFSTVYENLPIPFAGSLASALSMWLKMSNEGPYGTKTTDTIVKEALDGARIADNQGEVAAINSNADKFSDALETLRQNPDSADAKMTLKSRSEILIASTRRMVELCLANISKDGIAIPLSYASFIYLAHLCDCIKNAAAYGYHSNDLLEFRKDVYDVADRSFFGLLRYTSAAGYIYNPSAWDGKGDYDINKSDSRAIKMQKAILYFRQLYCNPCISLDSQRKCTFLSKKEDGSVSEKNRNYVLFPGYLGLSASSGYTTTRGIGYEPSLITGQSLNSDAFSSTIDVTCGGNVDIRLRVTPKYGVNGRSSITIKDNNSNVLLDNACFFDCKDSSNLFTGFKRLEDQNNFCYIQFPAINADNLTSITILINNWYCDMEYIQLEILTADA
eukprot:gene16178-19255_t